MRQRPDHSYTEIRDIALDLLAGREKPLQYGLEQYDGLLQGVADVVERREGPPGANTRSFGGSGAGLSEHDRSLCLEVFWSLFREGVITLGHNNANREFPWFRVSEFGQRILDGGDAYFFHDVSSYEKLVRTEVPEIDETTILYLKEAMQAFRVGCVLASTVMLGVATEHTFLLLVEAVQGNAEYSQVFASVGQQRTILQKVNKFKNVLDQQAKALPSSIKEDLDTQFAGILSIIRNFRNQSGHPTGKIIDREQAYVLLQLFIPYARKMYALRDHFE